MFPEHDLERLQSLQRSIKALFHWKGCLFFVFKFMGIKFEKTIAIIICILGVSGVAYGMAEENDVLFIVGLFFVAGGYLIIRRKLKGNAQRQNR